MSEKRENNTILNTKIWRYLTSFWTVVLYGVVIADFFTKNGLHEFLGPTSSIYIAALALYSAQKEFERWHDYNIGRHPGEIYVIIWTALILTLFGLEAIYNNDYKMPTEVFTTYIVVIGILAVTKKSKTSYNSKGWDNL
ncbi:MAG TPA: hypothetical protein VJG67_00300 [Candidatus Paceibacterota bacterium]